MGFQLEKLNSRHMVIAYLDVAGKTSKEIAKATGYHRNYVNNVRRTDVYQLALSELRSEVEDRVVQSASDLTSRFRKGADRAVDAMEELIRDDDPDLPVPPSTRLKAAVEWLNRSPNAPRPSQDGTNRGGVHFHFSQRITQNVRDALSDVGRDDLLEVMDAEYEEVEQEQLPAPSGEITATPIEDV